MRLTALLFTLSGCLGAEVYTLTQRQLVDLALRQNPDILIARLDEQKAAAAVREARDPFVPKLYVGSGLAYTSGFPMSIEGSAPSVLQARAVQTLYNRPLSYQVAVARENARGAAIDVESRRDAVLHRLLTMHLNAARSARMSELVRQQLASYEAIGSAVRARVEEGRELPVEARAAELRVAQTKQRLRNLEAEREQTEASLAIALGHGPDDRVRAADEERRQLELPASEVVAVEEALVANRQVRRLESALQAKQLQARGARSARYPQMDLVAQYALMARFNNYEEFFQRFERHNWQLGVSFQLPIFPGSAPSAQAAQAELEMARLRTEINDLRNRVAVDTRHAWTIVRNAEAARDLAKMDLDITRERLNVVLAQFEEGRASLREVEELRSAEAEKWVMFFDAQHDLEQARLDLLQRTGAIVAGMRAPDESPRPR